MIPYTTIPFLSALFLVLVGVLIGNLVWSRSRDRQVALSGQWRERAKRIASNLDDRTVQLQQMEELWEDLLQESEEMRSRLDSSEATAGRLQRERDEFESQCKQERETRINLAASLKDEQRQSAQWRERAAAASQADSEARQSITQSQAAAQEAAAEVERLRAKMQELQAEVGTLQDELTLARGPERDRLLSQLRQTEERLRGEVEQATAESVALGEQEAALRGELEQARREADTLREQLADLRPRLERTEEQLQQARGPEREYLVEEAAQREAELRSQATCLSGQLDESQREVDTLREQLAELRPRLEQTEEQLQQARGPEHQALLSQARQCEEALRSDLDRARRTAEELMDRLEQRDAELAHEASSRKLGEQKLAKRCEDLRESMLRQIERINEDRKQLEQRLTDEASLEADLVRQRQQLAECRQRSAEELERLAARLVQEEEKTRELSLQLRTESTARKQLQESQQILSRREQVLLDEIVPLRAVAEESKRLRRELAALQGQHDQLVASRAEEHERAEETHAQRLHLEEDLAVARREILSLQKKCNQLQSDWDSGRGSLANVQSELQDRETILQRLREAFRKSQAELATMSARCESLESAGRQERERQAIAEREAEAMRTHVADLRAQVSMLGEQLAARDASETELRTDLRDARAEVARLAPLEDQLVDQNATVKAMRDELRELKHHRDEAQQAVASMKEIVAELRDELAERLESFEISESDRSTVQREFQLERQRREQLAESCAQWEHDCHLAQEQLADLQDQKARLRGQLDEWQGRAQQAAEQATMLEQQVMDLQARLEQQEELTRQLRGRRMAERPSPAAEPRSGLSFLGLRAKERSQRDLEEMALRRDERLGRIYASAPRKIDDLTQIPGVTRDLQTRLQQLGIYTFQQVMEWDAAIAQEISSRLGLGGEMERDDWVGNARRLFHERQRLVA
jgi:chromosome segregation ATPase